MLALSHCARVTNYSNGAGAGYAMGFTAGEWVLGCVCRKCGVHCALLPDSLDGAGPIRAPLRGAFQFQCEACGACNALQAEQLQRFRYQRANTAAA
jgi:hypothetical protein